MHLYLYSCNVTDYEVQYYESNANIVIVHLCSFFTE